jgi:hypothetical protein
VNPYRILDRKYKGENVGRHRSRWEDNTVVQIWPGLIKACLHTVSPGHIWTNVLRSYSLVNISGLPRNFVRGGVQKIQLRTEGRENGVLGTVAPLSGVPLNLQMSETRILIRLLRMYLPRNWEFGSAFSKLRNFGGGGLNIPTPPPRYATGQCVCRLMTFVVSQNILCGVDSSGLG